MVRPLTVVPDLDGWAVVEPLLEDLGTLEDRIVLVIDDAHELGPTQALAQPPQIADPPARNGRRRRRRQQLAT